MSEKDMKELIQVFQRLQKEIEELERKNETDDEAKDPIYLLSEEEYVRYHDKIPKINWLWWLKDTSDTRNSHACCVDPTDVVTEDYKQCYKYGVCPVINLANCKFGTYLRGYHGDLIFGGMLWIKLDTNLYIAEVPIGFMEFDCDSEDYKYSMVREWLLDWYEDRRRMMV